MSSKSKIRGTRWESQVRDYLVAAGFVGVERRALDGNKDRGDLLGIPLWTLEAKDEARITLAGYMDEARAEAKNAGTPYFAAIVKRRRKGTGEAYAVMPLELLTRFMGRPL
jgi:hypothetical protein